MRSNSVVKPARGDTSDGFWVGPVETDEAHRLRFECHGSLGFEERSRVAHVLEWMRRASITGQTPLSVDQID